MEDATEPAAYSEMWAPTSEMNEQLAEFLQSPAYSELRDAVLHLHAARKQLLAAAAQSNGEGASAAMEAYNARIQRVQAALERVKDRVAPGELAVVLQDLDTQAQMHDVSLPAGHALYPWELGPHQQELAP